MNFDDFITGKDEPKEKYSEARTLNGVAEFHETFKHPILDFPEMPTKARQLLRVNLMKEELKELEEAIINEDLVGIADGFCDLEYVLNGSILEFGMGAAFAELFAEVQRSNMSKSCDTEEEAESTVQHYEDQGVDAYHKVDPKSGKWLVYRVADDKTLKSVNYSPANLQPILDDWTI